MTEPVQFGVARPHVSVALREAFHGQETALSVAGGSDGRYVIVVDLGGRVPLPERSGYPEWATFATFVIDLHGEQPIVAFGPGETDPSQSTGSPITASRTPSSSPRRRSNLSSQRTSTPQGISRQANKDWHGPTPGPPPAGRRLRGGARGSGRGGRDSPRGRSRGLVTTGRPRGGWGRRSRCW